MGTCRGLNRYNGIEFKVFEHNQKDVNSIPGNTILDIFEDHRKNLWIATNKGLGKFNRVLNNFKVCTFDDEDEKSLDKDDVNCILKMNSG